jgi:uncharacterized membrane protein
MYAHIELAGQWIEWCLTKEVYFMKNRKRRFAILAVFSLTIILILIMFYIWGATGLQNFNLLLLTLAIIFGAMCIVSIWLAYRISR